MILRKSDIDAYHILHIIDHLYYMKYRFFSPIMEAEKPIFTLIKA